MYADEIVARHVSVDRIHATGNPHGEGIGNDGEVVRTLEHGPVVAAIAHLEIARIVALRLGREDAHGATLAVLAEQRALRSAEDFDAIDVAQVEHGAKG